MINNANIPCIMEILNLMVNIHRKTCREEIKKKVNVMELKLRMVEQGEFTRVVSKRFKHLPSRTDDD